MFAASLALATAQKTPQTPKKNRFPKNRHINAGGCVDPPIFQK